MNVVAGAGSVMSSAGTYTAWIEVMDPLLDEAEPFHDIPTAPCGKTALFSNTRKIAQEIGRQIFHLVEKGPKFTQKQEFNHTKPRETRLSRGSQRRTGNWQARPPSEGENHDEMYGPKHV